MLWTASQTKTRGRILRNWTDLLHRVLSLEVTILNIQFITFVFSVPGHEKLSTVWKFMKSSSFQLWYSISRSLSFSEKNQHAKSNSYCISLNFQNQRKNKIRTQSQGIFLSQVPPFIFKIKKQSECRIKVTQRESEAKSDHTSLYVWSCGWFPRRQVSRQSSCVQCKRFTQKYKRSTKYLKWREEASLKQTLISPGLQKSNQQSSSTRANQPP